MPRGSGSVRAPYRSVSSHAPQQMSGAKLPSATCPTCGAGPTQLFVRSNDRDVLQCKSCRLLYSSPRPTQQEIGEFFAAQYITDRQRAEVDFATLREPTFR